MILFIKNVYFFLLFHVFPYILSICVFSFSLQWILFLCIYLFSNMFPYSFPLCVLLFWYSLLDWLLSSAFLLVVGFYFPIGSFFSLFNFSYSFPFCCHAFLAPDEERLWFNEKLSILKKFLWWDLLVLILCNIYSYSEIIYFYYYYFVEYRKVQI